MNNLWIKTLATFILCVLVFIPLMLVGVEYAPVGFWQYFIVMVLGWFAGAIIVGNYFRLRNVPARMV